MPRPPRFCRSYSRPSNRTASSDTDCFAGYDTLDVSGFHHVRINHSEKFVEAKNHINGIENFWNQSKRHLRRYNGIPKQHFHLFLKECEWRFNYRPASNLLKTLLAWAIR